MDSGAHEVLHQFIVNFIVNVEAAIHDGSRYLMIVRGSEEEHAPGTLSFPGGKVEIDAGTTNLDSILEQTLLREIAEEVGIRVDENVRYVESKFFAMDDGRPVIDIVFLCRYRDGEPVTGDAGEVASVQWMSAAEILQHEKVPPWIRRSITLAEGVIS